MRIGFMRPLLLCVALAVALAQVGCSRPGAEYIGKWQSLKNKNDQFEIVRNGDNFLVTKTRSGKPSGATITCALQDGALRPVAGLPITLTYVKSTDRLTTPGLFGGNVEYERLK